MVFSRTKFIYFVSLCIVMCSKVSCQSNPLIIQDSRLEPKVDGTFGFQYRTEDGISHVAQGDPTGYIQGSYSYKDPTGLKVNFNYFAGGRNNPSSTPRPARLTYNSPQQQQQQQYVREPSYTQTNQEYIPRTRPPAAYTNDQQNYEPKYTSSSFSRLNEVYDRNDQY